MDAIVRPAGVHIKRPKGIPARVLSSDFTVNSVRLFTTDPIEPGTLVSMTLGTRHKFYFRGRVAWIRRHDLRSNIKVAGQKFSWRMGIIYEPTTVAAKDNFKSYTHSFLKENEIVI